MSKKILKFPLALSLITAGLAMTSTAMAEGKIPVVASFSILGDLVSQVGGDNITLTTLVKADADAHVYSPTPKDAQAVTQAKLLVINGLEFEGWMPRLLESANFIGQPLVASTGIDVMQADDEHEDEHPDNHNDGHDDHEEEHKHQHDHGKFDPHAWHSITNVKIYVRNIEQGLSKVDPENSSYYAANAGQYIDKLDQLNVQLHAQIDKIPPAQRKVITAHDAFAYFAHDFELRFIAPQSSSTESEASAADIVTIIKQIRRDKINAVFMENISDNRMIEQISRETGAKIGGKLFSDALSGPEGPAANYVQMMKYNVETIVNALSH